MSSYVQASFEDKFIKLIQDKNYDQAEKMLADASDIPKNIKYFNLGYLNYEKGNLVEAKRFYELAEIHGMLGKDVSLSLKKINQELSISSLEDRYTSYEDFLITYKNLPQAHLFLGLSIFLTVTLIGVVKKWHILTGIGFSLIVISGFYFMEIQKYELSYVEKDKLIQRGPSVIFEETGVLPAGAKVLYSKEKNQWRYIQYPEVFRGWINTERDDF